MHTPEYHPGGCRLPHTTQKDKVYPQEHFRAELRYAKVSKETYYKAKETYYKAKEAYYVYHIKEAY